MNLKIGVLGTSAIGMSHVRNFRDIPGVSVVSVYSRNNQRAAIFARNCGIAHYTTDLNEFLENDIIDAVLITTEPARHIDLARKCCAAKKHVLIEKPLDIDLEKSLKFAEEMSQSTITLSVVSQMRFDPALNDLYQCLPTVLGNSPLIASMSIMRCRDQSYYESGSGWRIGYNPFFVNQGIHWIDVLGWYFGRPINVRRISRITRPFLTSSDQTAAIIEFDSGAVVTLIGGSFCDQDHEDNFRIFGAQGSWDYRQARFQGKRIFRKLTPFLKHFDKRLLRNDTLYLQAADFIEAIRHNQPPTTTLDQAIAALSLAQEISHLEH